MRMANTAASSIVPVLVDQFNDIIHWRAKTLKEELQSFEQQKVATPKVIPYLTSLNSSTTSSTCDVPCDSSRSVLLPLDRSFSFNGLSHQDVPLALRKSKSQKQFSRKLNRIRARAESNTICETTEYEVDDTDPVKDTENFLQAIHERLLKCRNVLEQSHNERLAAAAPVELLPDCDTFVCDTIISNPPVQELPPVIQPVKEEFEPEFKPARKSLLFDMKQKTLPSSNILLRKLQNIHQHGFVVKTIVVEKMSLLGSRTGFLDKDEQSGICCACGESYMFSDKHLQCITCLTRCHTTCGSEIATPCVKFVDPYLKPSSCISAYVFPRARPSIPCLILHCVREIEHRLQQESRPMVAPPKLYYVDVQKMKPIKDECKRLIMRSRFGVPPMNSYTFDYLSAMVKLFLGDICEPVFGKEQWKEYSQTVRKYLKTLISTFSHFFLLKIAKLMMN